MRKLFITIAIVLATATCFGETTEKGNLVRNGNTFSIERTTKSTTTKEKQPDVAIGAQWEDEEGTYDIYMGAKGGLYYYKMAKTGKHAGELTKRYIPKDKAQEIKDAMGINN